MPILLLVGTLISVHDIGSISLLDQDFGFCPFDHIGFLVQRGRQYPTCCTQTQAVSCCFVWNSSFLLWFWSDMDQTQITHPNIMNRDEGTHYLSHIYDPLSNQTAPSTGTARNRRSVSPMTHETVWFKEILPFDDDLFLRWVSLSHYHYGTWMDSNPNKIGSDQAKWVWSAVFNFIIWFIFRVLSSKTPSKCSDLVLLKTIKYTANLIISWVYIGKSILVSTDSFCLIPSQMVVMNWIADEESLLIKMSHWWWRWVTVDEDEPWRCWWGWWRCYKPNSHTARIFLLYGAVPNVPPHFKWFISLRWWTATNV